MQAGLTECVGIAGALETGCPDETSCRHGPVGEARPICFPASTDGNTQVMARLTGPRQAGSRGKARLDFVAVPSLGSSHDRLLLPRPG